MQTSTLKWALPIALSAIATAVMVGHHAHATDNAAPVPAMIADHNTIRIPEGSPLRTRLKVQATGTINNPHRLGIPGQIDANPAQTVNVLPALAGRIVDLKVAVGDHVSKGQTLALIASGDMAQAYSDYDKAADAENLAKAAFDRVKGVEKAGAAAIKDLETAESTLNQAKAETTRARTRLEAVGGSPGSRIHNIAVQAPVNGIVTALNVGRGSVVNDVTAALMTISDLSTVWATANVAEDQVKRVSKGQPVDIMLAAFPDEILHGKVSSTPNVLSADTRRLPVHIVLDNKDGRLLPNMYATVILNVPQTSQAILPQSALLMNNDSTTVFVEVSPWVFTRRTIEIGEDEGDQVRVRSGLKAGERVVVQGGVLLND